MEKEIEKCYFLFCLILLYQKIAHWKHCLFNVKSVKNCPARGHSISKIACTVHYILINLNEQFLSRANLTAQVIKILNFLHR